MAEIVNLNRFRKTKARAKKKAQANENAVKFGRCKAQKALERDRIEKDASHVDGHRRDE